MIVGEPAWVTPTGGGVGGVLSGFGVWRPGSAARACRGRERRAPARPGSRPGDGMDPGARAGEGARRGGASARWCGDHGGPEGRDRGGVDGEEPGRVTAILDELAGRYDAVLYFCAPGPHRQLTRAGRSGRWPTSACASCPQGAPTRSGGWMSASTARTRGVFGRRTSEGPAAWYRDVAKAHIAVGVRAPRRPAEIVWGGVGADESRAARVGA